MVVLIKIVQVIFALSILVLAHELGHFYLQNFLRQGLTNSTSF